MKIKYLFLCIFPLLFFSCEEKNESENIQNALIGQWQLQSVEIDGAETDLSAYPNQIEFLSNRIFLSHNTATGETVRGGWSYEGDMLNISVYLPAAFYILKADTHNLILKRLDFNPNGTLITTISKYNKP